MLVYESYNMIDTYEHTVKGVSKDVKLHDRSTKIVKND